jgi:hypothetical protein
MTSSPALNAVAADLAGSAEECSLMRACSFR